MKDFQTKKKFGQNFLTDGNLLNAICVDAGLTKNDEVLEIGPGMGALTEKICEHSKKVESYEIDKDLIEILQNKGFKNANFHFIDVLEVDLNEIEKDFKNEYKLVANIPYYITTPIIFKFLGKSKKVKSMTMMVQKEVAERIVAPVGSKDYGILSVCCQMQANCSIKRIVKRNMFHPAPNVDSAIVHLEIKDTVLEEGLVEFVKNIFSMRRKTLLNNISSTYGLKKEEVERRLEGFDLTARAEKMTIEEIKEMYFSFKNN